jgi:hypothetical protein
VTTHAPLRSRWTNAVPVYHVRVTGNADSLPSPRKDTTLEGVGWTRLILIEAPSSAYHRGMLALGKQQQPQEEETFYVAVLVKPFLSSP